MPWLKWDETDKWNHDNLEQQWIVANRNSWVLLENIGWKGTEWYNTLLARYNHDWSTNKWLLDLQRDLAALHTFVREGLGERIQEINFEDKNGIYNQIKTIMGRNGTPTFPKMVQDALTAIKSVY